MHVVESSVCESAAQEVFKNSWRNWLRTVELMALKLRTFSYCLWTGSDGHFGVCVFNQLKSRLRAPFWCGLFEHARDGRLRDAVELGDLRQAVVIDFAVLDDPLAINVERLASQAAAFQACPAHTGAYALDDQRTLEFRNGTDDDHDGAAQRTSSIEVLAEADELDVEVAERVEQIKEILDRARQAIAGPH